MDMTLLSLRAIVFVRTDFVHSNNRENITVCNYLHIPSRNKISSDLILLKCFVDCSTTSINNLYKVRLQ